MNGRTLRWCALAAMLAISACGGGGGAGEVAADSTQPASGTQVPQANPQTEARRDTPVGTVAAPPAPGSAAGRTYADCEAENRGKSAEEREIMLRACASLPGAPR